jgi:hypothetical protein
MKGLFMDRKQWLTMVYREANHFIELNASPEGKLTETEVDELEPELHRQLQEIMGSVDSLEDIVKHSLLKNPPPDLWYGESNWQHVLIAVALSCLLHDVKGVVIRILDGSLPKTPSSSIMDAL